MANNITRRMSLFPITDEEAYKFYCIQEGNTWSAKELDFSHDAKHYRAASKEKKRIIDTILMFFVPGDGFVNNNIIHDFLPSCQTAEETMFFVSQLNIEIVHAETYGLIALSFYGMDGIEELITKAENSEYIQKKFTFGQKWSDKKYPRAIRQIAWACFEGIFFSVLFCMIFWFRSAGNNFPNLIHSNELISRDETLHRDFSCFLFRKYDGVAKYADLATKIVKEAVEIEYEFINYILGDGVEDLKPEDVRNYVGLVADNLLYQAGLPRIYKKENPFSWMSDIALVQKNSFYEIRGGSYSRGSKTDNIALWKKVSEMSLETGSVDTYADISEVDF